MNLGGGAVVEGDYRLSEQQTKGGGCCTTGYRKTANHKLVIKIHTVRVSTGMEPSGEGKNT